MRRSFVRLVVESVLSCWALGFVVLFAYLETRSWTDTRARGDSVFLFHELLEATPPPARAERVRALQSHTTVRLSILSRQAAQTLAGRAVDPGDQIPLRLSRREEWYLLAFEDGEGVFAAGPVDPGNPEGFSPIGIFIAIAGIPLIAGIIALRLERALAKVERASEALAVGELSARVEDPRGPSNELAAKFNAMAERIEHLVRSRDELVQAVSHELGSPLSRLRFQMELLGNLSEAEREQRLDAMNRELDALDELVAELLTYVQSDDLKVDRRRFDPARGLSDLAELAVLEGPEDRTVDVQTSLPEGIEVFADPRLFLRAVENTLRNSVRHARARVRLEVADEGNHIRVTVHDDGPGIPEDARDKVTAPFFRLDKDRHRGTGGVGLGLAIVSRIMRQHGGSVQFETSDLGGAMVSTLWPKRA